MPLKAGSLIPPFDQSAVRQVAPVKAQPHGSEPAELLVSRLKVAVPESFAAALLVVPALESA